MANIYDILQQNLVLLCLAAMLLLIQHYFANLLSPQWQSRFWGLLFLRALLPYGLFSGELILNTEWIVSNLRVAVELPLNSAYASAFVRSLPMVPWFILPSTIPRSISDWLFLAYFTWVVGAMSWFLYAWWRLCQHTKQAAPVTGAKFDAIQTVATAHKLPMPKRIVESASAFTPFVMGVFRPTLVLPMNAPLEESIILHELLHIKHHDVLWGWATTLLRCYYPTLWRVCDQIDNARESACDERVLLRLKGEARRDYGKALFAMAEDRFTHQVGATTMANGTQNIKKRITAIAKFRAFPRGIGLVAVCMLCILFAQMASAAAPTTETLDNTVLPTSAAAQALAYGQRNAPTTLAGALDFYTQGLSNRAVSPWQSFAYLAAVSDAETQASLYQTYADAFDETRINDIEESFQIGPVIRALSQDGDGNYLCEVLLYRIEPTALDEADTQNETLTYQKHTISITEQADGTWQVSSLATEEKSFNSDDLSHLREATPVQWVGEIDGTTITYCDMSQLFIHETYSPWSTNALGSYLLTNNHSLSSTETPSRDAGFASCVLEHSIALTAQDGTTVTEIGDAVGMKLEVRYGEGESETEVLYLANWATGQITTGSRTSALDTSVATAGAQAYPVFDAPENQVTYSTGTFYTENLQTIVMTAEPLHYYAVLIYEYGHTTEVALERQVILP